MSWETREELAVLRYREEQQERKIRMLQRQMKKQPSSWKKLWYAAPLAVILFLYSETEIGIQGLQITKSGLIILGIIYLLTLVIIYAKKR